MIPGTYEWTNSSVLLMATLCVLMMIILVRR
jgi:hypothetical protein